MALGEGGTKMDARLNNMPRVFRAAAVAMVGFAMACGLLILVGGLASPVVAAPLADTVISSDITGDTTWDSGWQPLYHQRHRVFL